MLSVAVAVVEETRGLPVLSGDAERGFMQPGPPPFAAVPVHPISLAYAHHHRSTEASRETGTDNMERTR